MRVYVADTAIELSPPVTPATGAIDVEREVLWLFDRFRDPLLRYVCAVGIPVGEGEDLIQEVFLALFRHLRRNGSRSNLPGWLFRVAHNLALKRRARLRREHARRRSDVRPAMALIDPGDDPEARLLDHHRRKRLRSVFDALPERDQQCLHLRGSGLRYREIARVLDMSLGTVAKTLTRAVARLQRADEG